MAIEFKKVTHEHYRMVNTDHGKPHITIGTLSFSHLDNCWIANGLKAENLEQILSKMKELQNEKTV